MITSTLALLEIAGARHPFCSSLLSAKNSSIIVGEELFERNDKDVIFSVVETVAKLGKVVRPDWNALNLLLLNAAQAAALDLGTSFLNLNAAQAAALDLGLVSETRSSIESAKFLYLMGADDVSLDKLPDDAFVVYQGHHGDRNVYRANVILPASAFSEKEGTNEDTEG